MDDRAMIKQAVDRYRIIDQLGMEIEHAVQQRALDTLPLLCAHLEQLQEEVKSCDRAVLDLLQRQKELKDCGEIVELQLILHRIERRNRQMTTQIKSIMVVQRNELHTLKRGHSVLQGYRPGLMPTGRRLSSSG